MRFYDNTDKINPRLPLHSESITAILVRLFQFGALYRKTLIKHAQDCCLWKGWLARLALSWHPNLALGGFPLFSN